MNKRLFPLVQAAMIAAALIGGNAASIVSAEDAPVIPQETALTDSAEPAATEPEATADEPAETPEEPKAPAEPEIVEFAAEPEEAALEALMSAPVSEPIEPEIVQAAAETLSAMPTARKAAALKAMRPVTYVPEGLPEGVTLSVDVPPAAFSEPVEIYARFLTDPEDGRFSEDIIAAAQAQYEEAMAACEEGYSAGIMLFDLSFVNEAGEEVEPALPVSVNLAFPQADEAVEITGVRHFTDAEDVEVYEDLDFTADNSEELTLNYITESCSQFTIRWTKPDNPKRLIISYVEDELYNNRLIQVDYPKNGGDIRDNTPYQLDKTSTIEITNTAIKRRYHFVGVTDETVPPTNTSSYLPSNCNWVQYYEPDISLGEARRRTGWGYNSNGNIGNFLEGHYLDPQSRFPNAQNKQDTLSLLLVYYPDLTFYYGTNTFSGNAWHEDGFRFVSDSQVVLNTDAYAENPDNLDPTQYKLYICTDPEHPFETAITSNFTRTNGYKNHPNDGMDFYFVYVKLDTPAPTGVTQKAAPYAAMVILAAVSAAVMIKRRKGGDVDETSPL